MFEETRFDDEGGAMRPVSPITAEEIRRDNESGPIVVGYMIAALSGAVAGAILMALFI